MFPTSAQQGESIPGVAHLINIIAEQKNTNENDKIKKGSWYKAKKNEHQKSSVRAKVEHVFSVIKNLFAFRKTRYRGKRKQFAKLNFLFALANLYLADRRFDLSV